VPEGKYTVTFYIGDPGDTSTTTIKAESRRLLVENLHLAKGQFATRTFTIIRRESSIAGGGSVSLDYSHGREDPSICLDWDHKLTFEFCGARPCIGGLDIVPVDSGITFHLCGNSTIVEQENEPWSCWGQFIHRFYNSGIIINDLGSSGLQSSSFKNQKRLAKICSVMKPGDYLFFEFGHNEDATDAGRATFKQNMQTYYDSATKHQATMVFVTPTARHADTDPATSVGQFAQNTRDYAKALTGSKVVDLNAAVLDMKAALANPAYGSDNTAIYCHVPASPLWPDQPAVNDGTHFCDFGGYELAKWVAQTGMKAAGIDLQKYLLDTAAFDPNKPDLKSAWGFSFSLDTVFRHSTPGATVYKDTVSAVTGLISNGSISSFPHSLSMNAGTFTIEYSFCEAGNSEISIFSMNGKVAARKRLALQKTGRSHGKNWANCRREFILS
jgi:lysophospholipase L1-like esterase